MKNLFTKQQSNTKISILCGFVLMLIAFLFSCSDTNTPAETVNNNNCRIAGEAVSSPDERSISYTGTYSTCIYKLDKLPADITTLYKLDTVNGRTDMDGKNYLLWAQSGPKLKFSTEYTPFSTKLTDQTKWTILQVHQYQTLHNDYAKTAELDFAVATEYSAFSAAALFAVARHFKNAGKKVYIASNSFGSFIVPKMIADYKYENYVEKVIMTAGRLQMPALVVETFKNGNAIGFEDTNSDGFFTEVQDVSRTQYINIEALNKQNQQTYNDILSQYPGFTVTEVVNNLRSERKLQASLAQYNFVKIYTDNTISLTKLHVTSGKLDSKVGYLLSAEIAIIPAGNFYASEGGHSVSRDADLDYYVDLLENN